MSAQPIHEEDPRDPAVILRDLPERERAFFLRQYKQKAQAAVDDPAGYKELQQFLHLWSLTVIATNRPGYYENLEAVKNGTAPTVPIEDVIPDWAERVAAARADRQT